MRYVLGFEEIDKSKVEMVGGKGANLGELARIDGICVPAGFCITTDAFRKVIESTPSVVALIDRLSKDNIAKVTQEIRRVIEGIAVPGEIAREVAAFLTNLGETNAYAVRSSATAEDLPTASFAGQQDTYLNISGKEAILKHISKCWASLFTERAVTYRIQNGFDHRKVLLSVVVQEMVPAAASGILFTADPVNGNRKITSIDAGFGLGEALVSGIVNPDAYKVNDGIVVSRRLSFDKQVLSERQILQLEGIGRKIEKHFGTPQDIEWCLAGDEFHIVQSRPITTLYPVPEANDNENHVYISVGHQQMMTAAMKPLGLSFFLLNTVAVMRAAGGRLFVDVTKMLASPARGALLNTFGQSDPLIKDALQAVVEREDFIKPLPLDSSATAKTHAGPLPPHTQLENDPNIVADLIKINQSSVEELKQNIQSKSGTDLFDFIVENLPQERKINFEPRSMGAIMASINAAAWINQKMEEWLGEKKAADTFSQSVPNNVTSEMGLALLSVADAIRPYPGVIDHLQHVKSDDFLDELVTLDGGVEARDAINDYLNKYGMRCAGEIDITQTRWSEKPITLVPLILGNIKNFGPGEGKRKFEQGQREALTKEKELLDRLRRLPDGDQKAKDTKFMIDQVRTFAGFREYPKYGMVNRYFVYKQALLKEADRLVQANVIENKEDVYFLSFQEFREAIRVNKVDRQVIEQRKEEHKLNEKLTPPRVITSDGEIVTAKYKHEDLPAGAIPGLAVSSGTVEGRARVILNIGDADMDEGDILVTTFTDPSWTPVFVSIKGLVTEVGGLMSHGAVIAREYGLPAVVGIDNATKLIRDGQRIRVNGTDGYVEILL